MHFQTCEFEGVYKNKLSSNLFFIFLHFFFFFYFSSILFSFKFSKNQT